MVNPTTARSMLVMVEHALADLDADDRPGYQGHWRLVRTQLWAIEALDQLGPPKPLEAS